MTADYKALGVLRSIAHEVDALRDEFLQLVEFSPTKHLDDHRLVIDYEYHTHVPEPQAGWNAALPKPDHDGVWIYIDIHSPESEAQLHKQNVQPKLCWGDREVSFLILEGDQTASVKSRLWDILQKAGVQRCADPL